MLEPKVKAGVVDNLALEAGGELAVGLLRLTRFCYIAPATVYSRTNRFTNQSIKLFRLPEKDVMEDKLPTAAVQCAICKGTGAIESLRCDACEGSGQLLVVAPAIPCPRCHGTGLSPGKETLARAQNCAVCVGAGWARIVWGEAR